MSEDKIVVFSKLRTVVSKLKAKNKKIVFTNGCFDLIHTGHVKYLEKARSFGDILIVGINSDSSMKKIKGSKRPIIAQGDRARIIAGLESVDYVSIFDEATPLRLIKAVKPDVLVKGADWELTKMVGADYIKSYGGSAISIPLVKGRSTSHIIRKIVSRFK